jgi:hypothetical protein
MIVYDSLKKRVKIEVTGDYEAPEIVSAIYTDSKLDVPDEEVEFILSKYFNEICMELAEASDYEMGS